MAKNDFDFPSNNYLVDDDKMATMAWGQWFQRIHTIASSLQQSGPTSERPTKLLWIGRRYFDTSLNMPVWVTAVDANGVATWSGALGVAYGQFSNTTTQGITTANTAQTVFFNSVDLIGAGFSIAGAHLITLREGVYSVGIAAQVFVTGGGTANLDIWMRKNGVDVTNSNTRTTLAGSVNNLVMSQPYLFTMAANDYLEVIMSSNLTTAGLLAIPAQVGPTRPATPSIILTINRTGTI